MSARLSCRGCGALIAQVSARLFTLTCHPTVVDALVARHDCPNGPARCPTCLAPVAATKNLPAQLLGNVLHNHRRYCKGNLCLT